MTRSQCGKLLEVAFAADNIVKRLLLLEDLQHYSKIRPPRMIVTIEGDGLPPTIPRELSIIINGNLMRPSLMSAIQSTIDSLKEELRQLQFPIDDSSELPKLDMPPNAPETEAHPRYGPPFTIIE